MSEIKNICKALLQILCLAFLNEASQVKKFIEGRFLFSDGKILTILNAPLRFFLMYMLIPLFAIETVFSFFIHLCKESRKTLSHPDTESARQVPPVSADYLLHVFLARRNRRETIGDLTEEFHEDVLPRFGARAARLWYWKKALTAIMERNPIARRILVGGGLLKAGEWIWKAFAG